MSIIGDHLTEDNSGMYAPPEMDGTADPALLKKARELYHEDGSIEIDDNAQISVGDEGTWVQAWVYVPHEEGEDDERP